ncbi:MAG: hypothetical protein IJH64_06125 [Oscillospiraceae bacterium]|nr:hypothetical protein [Oscillospiraceae bacterium]MBR0452235.1 hypothetical protein [Oscillospiraceae bacterium]
MSNSLSAKNVNISVTANTCVRDYGQYVLSFTMCFDQECDLSGISTKDFKFTKTSKHPIAGHESFGAWKVEKTDNSLTVFVDPFLFNDTYEGEAALGDEPISLSKADITDMKVAVVDDFEALTAENGMAYRLLVPESDGPLPLVVAFHGNGESGTDNYKHMANNRVITKWGEPQSQSRYKCIVLGPQSNNRWSDDELAEVRKIIDRLIDEGKADPRRIYAAGLAPFQVTLRFAVANKDLLAGVLSMLFWKKYSPDMSSLKDLPIWFAIGVNDSTGESPYVKEIYQYFIEDLQNKNVRCTVFPEDEMQSYGLYSQMTHWGWIPALNNPEICDWLFAQHKQ